MCYWAVLREERETSYSDADMHMSVSTTALPHMYFQLIFGQALENGES